MGQLLQFPPRPRIEPPGTPLTAEQREALREEDRRRMLQNAAAAVFVLALTALGFWVTDRVMSYSKNVTCLQLTPKSCR